VCALLLARQEAAVAATRRLQSEFIWDLLEGRIPDEAEALVRARHLDHRFELPARLLLAAVEGLERQGRSEGWTAEQLERARARTAHAVAERVREVAQTRPVSARRADLFVAVVPLWAVDAPDRARSLARVVVSTPAPVGVRFTVGVSGPVRTVAGFPEAYRQARFALSAAAGSPEGARVFEDLGVLQFLLAPAERADLERFARHVLGPVIDYDRAHRGELVRTLEAYLEADCSLQRSADLLFVHHKTMRYRLQRIQELAGLKLDRQEDRFRAHLALKILSLDRSAERGGRSSAFRAPGSS
jgi:sugar diacid utilization regulator